MLIEVRAGYNVLGIFYGHPGVFVSPSHRAIALAREEGYNAKMLPGISAEDYLFADLEFDPATYGCMTSEATELLMRNTPLNTSVHNIIWQVGSVGVTTMVFDASVYMLSFISNPGLIIDNYAECQVPSSRRSPRDRFWTGSQGRALHRCCPPSI